MRHAHIIIVGKPEKKRPLKETGVDKRTTLEWILKK
jgi:hypothetical protein